MRRERQHVIRLWQGYFCAKALANICSFLQISVKLFCHAVFQDQTDDNFKNVKHHLGTGTGFLKNYIYLL